jgi:hypothetical protein
MRRNFPPMRRTLLLLTLITVPFLAGCGDDGGGRQEATTDLGAVELIRSAPDALAEAGTAHLELTVETGGLTVDASGQFDFDAQTGAMTMEVPPPIGSEVETVFDGTTYYMSAGLFGGAIPGLDAEWIRVDLDDLAGQAGVDLSQLPQGANNPADALDALAAVSQDGLEELGTEEVRGVETTHYAAEIDMAAAVEAADEQTGGELLDDAMAEQFLAQYGDEPVPVEVWIDGDGLVHRQTMTISAAGEEATMTMEMFDYGQPVDVQIPDASETVDFGDLIGGLTDN